MSNPYRVLGVSSTMSKEEIKAVYRQLSKKYHPDMKTGDAEKFRKVNEAWKEIDKHHKDIFGSHPEGNMGRGSMYIHKTLFTVSKV